MLEQPTNLLEIMVLLVDLHCDAAVEVVGL
jgi:hypothetical protein